MNLYFLKYVLKKNKVETWRSTRSPNHFYLFLTVTFSISLTILFSSIFWLVIISF
ncbi:hypothetical protein Scep_013064 [Stephania cephalantha]|uniref:Uncharacterized protein n=1 Tax=Stephania cephalantha TaxID=152367 RepID=A0AAP0JGB8_9MAGN